MFENLDFRKSEQYTLSIRLTTDGFYFLFFNPLESEAKQFSTAYIEADEDLSLTANLKKVFKQTEWLQYSFKRVNVLVDNGRFTLVPLEFFDEKLLSTYFHHNLSENENEQLAYNTLGKADLSVIFGMDHSAYHLLNDSFNNVCFMAEVSPLIEYFATQSKPEGYNRLFVKFGKGRISIYGYEKGHLLLCNTFAYNTLEDSAYFILSCWKQLRLDQEHDELCLYGAQENQDKLRPLLQHFIQKVTFVDNSDNIDLQIISSCE